MKKKQLFFMLLAMLGIAMMLASCSKDDTDTFVNITVQKDGVVQSGVTVCMFNESHAPGTGFFQPFYAQKRIATSSNGVAYFELEEVSRSSQETLYFGVFEGEITDATCLGYAAITIKKGETKSATINIGGKTTYDDNENNNGYTTSKKYTIKQVVKETVMTVHSQTYTGAANNRTYVTVQLPKNTVSWYYAVSSQFAKTGTPTLGLLAGLMKFLDPSAGLLANSISSLSVPTGTADVNVYFITELNDLNKFTDKSGVFTTYVEGTRKGINCGIVDVEVSADQGAKWFLGLENPDLKDAIYVTIEVCALVYE